MPKEYNRTGGNYNRLGKNNNDPAGSVEDNNTKQRQVEKTERGEQRTDPAAAREIAKKIEAKGGFWGPRK